MYFNIDYQHGNCHIFASKRNKFPDQTECDLKLYKMNEKDRHKIMFSNIGMPITYIGLYAKSDSQITIKAEYTKRILKDYDFSKPKNILEKALH